MLTFVIDIAAQFATRDAECNAQQFGQLRLTEPGSRAVHPFERPAARRDYGASRYVPWSAIDSHRLPLCVYVTPVSVRWWKPILGMSYVASYRMNADLHPSTTRYSSVQAQIASRLAKWN